MAKVIMIQGTMSSAGKSLIVTGLCRVFHQAGFRVAPFKSQNMALNSFVTEDGLEMGRAQVVQAEAAGIKPSVLMNPILLKPTSDMGSQVIVHGEVLGQMTAADYHAYKPKLMAEVRKAYDSLAEQVDIIVIEGAGSPAEINLREHDLVNMGLAELVDAPVLLVGDIDRGGVFAQLVGTMMLLEPAEQDRVKGFIINKFRGDIELLRPGISMLEDRAQRPVIGTLPYLKVDLEDEDSLTNRFQNQTSDGQVEIAVIRLPKISNFTDFSALEAMPEVNLRYVSSPGQLGQPDLIILPGTKNTMADLDWLKQTGLAGAIIRFAKQSGLVFGICGGYQMLGTVIRDPQAVEGGGDRAGLGLLPIATDFFPEKFRQQMTGVIQGARGGFVPLNGIRVTGYEIHMGQSSYLEGATGLVAKADGQPDGCSHHQVAGSYLHGFFDETECREALLDVLFQAKGFTRTSTSFDYQTYKEKQYDDLAKAIRQHLDLTAICQIMGLTVRT